MGTRTEATGSGSYCDQGHPEHDPRYGCGPCQDERDAMGVERVFAGPTR